MIDLSDYSSYANTFPATNPGRTDSFLETKRNELLAAACQGQPGTFARVLGEFKEACRTADRLKENDEKTVRQVLVIFSRFYQAIPGLDPSCLDDYHFIKTNLAERVRTSARTMETITLKSWLEKNGPSKAQFKLAVKTLMTFQLTTGCSHFCRRCNEWALPGVRRHFDKTAVSKILDRADQEENKEISLYGASDPLDWEDGEFSISSIVDHFDGLTMEYSLLTKVPKGKKDRLTCLLETSANLSVSVTTKNKKRIKKIEAETRFPIFKQHDSDDLLIRAGLDEDFSTVKPSITDGYGTEITPDGLFIIIPTFTSALNPFGHKKIPVTPDTCFFPEKKTGRHALLVDYFKPLRGTDLQLNPVTLEALVDVQIESIILDSGEEALTPPGMRSVKEYLEIFDETARKRRKQMLPSLFRHLRKDHLNQVRFRDLSRDTRHAYRKKVQGHIDLCKAGRCLDYKWFAISFFLESVRGYIETHPLERTIIEYLLRDEIRTRQPAPAALSNPDTVKSNLSLPADEAFNWFRIYLISLVTGRLDAGVNEFIRTHPACFDPDKDIFTGRQ